MDGSKRLATSIALMMGLSSNSWAPIGNRENKESVCIDDIQEEYDLIMAKKSKLSKSQRDAIVRQYKALNTEDD